MFAVAVVAAVFTAGWALSVSNAEETSFLAAFLIAGVCAGIGLLCSPSTNISTVNLLEALKLGIILSVYQGILFFALKSEGPRAQAVVNSNILIIAIINFIKTPSPPTETLSLIAASVIYILVGMYISYANTVKPSDDADDTTSV